jgi:hypothetical protein
MRFFVAFGTVAMFCTVALAAEPVLADQKAADGCAAALRGDSRVIYDDVLPTYKPGADLRAVVTERTKGLVAAGKIDRASARTNAMAAGHCLQKE